MEPNVGEDIKTIEQLNDWLQTQDLKMIRTIASRAALRSLPSLIAESGQNLGMVPSWQLLLNSIRALLTVAVASNCSEESVSQVEGIAEKLAHLPIMNIGIHAAVTSCAHAVHSAARSARTTFDCTQSTIETATAAKDAFAERGEASLRAVFIDAENGKSSQPLTLYHRSLWQGAQRADAANIGKTKKTEFETLASNEPSWSFWREWYQGFLDGKPLDWELQRRVALIDDAIWDAGLEAVAKEIEKIRENFWRSTKEKERYPEFEPKSVAHLIENRVIATASLQGLSVQIADAIEQYHAETGANALPDAFASLSEMPSLLEAIASSLKRVPDSGQASPDLVQHLREENGRLNAKISELEQELQKLRLLDPKLATRSKLGNLFSFLKKTSLIGGIVSGLWVLSGDDLGAKQRYERLIADWEFTKDLVQGEVSPAQGLPTTQVGTSLRPVAKPKNN